MCQIPFYPSIGNFSGILSFLYTKDTNLIDISSSSTDHHYPSIVLNRPEDSYWGSSNLPNSSIVFYIRHFKIIPLQYSVRSSYSNDGMVRWVFQGSNNNISWTTLHNRSNGTTSFLGEDKIFDCPSNLSFSYFRVLQTGLNSHSRNYLRIYQFDIFGKLTCDSHYTSQECVLQFPPLILLISMISLIIMI